MASTRDMRLSSPAVGLGGGLRDLWAADRWLTGAGLLFLALIVPSAAGIWLDPRIITGAPAWLKPTKFAVSLAIYTLTLAWFLAFLPDGSRVRRMAGRSTAVLLIAELCIIDLQAWRGTTSHFNVGTPLDGILFAIMGLGILLQTLVSVAVAVALWRQAFADRALGWSIRLGLAITIIGASVGGVMTQPTTAQIAEARATGRLAVAGAHTVGAPDGGPGLPGTGWSTQHGDLRIPHFLGLHAMQLLPLFALAIRRRTESTRVRLVAMAAAVYLLAFAGLLTLALRGLPLVASGVS